MESKESEAQADKQTGAEHKEQQPPAKWKEIFSGAWQDFSPGYLPNLVVSLIFLLVAPAIGVIMNRPKIIIGSFALGLTLLIWVLAVYLMRHASSPAPIEQTAPIPAPTPPQLQGVLIPANDPSPPNPCGQLPPEAVSVFFGNVVAYTRTFPMVALRIHGVDVLTLKKTSDGLALSAQIFSPDGRIIAELEDNEFHVNPNNYFKVKRPDRSTLIVYDQQNKAVLNVRYLNQQAVKVAGIFSTATTPRPLVIDDERVQLRSFAPGSRFCLGENRYGLILPSGPVITPDDLLK